jgi:hypothetical protein
MSEPMLFVGNDLVYENSEDMEDDEKEELQTRIKKSLYDVMIRHDTIIRAVDDVQQLSLDVRISHTYVTRSLTHSLTDTPSRARALQQPISVGVTDIVACSEEFDPVDEADTKDRFEIVGSAAKPAATATEANGASTNNRKRKADGDPDDAPVKRPRSDDDPTTSNSTTTPSTVQKHDDNDDDDDDCVVVL